MGARVLGEKRVTFCVLRVTCRRLCVTVIPCSDTESHPKLCKHSFDERDLWAMRDGFHLNTVPFVTVIPGNDPESHNEA